MIKNSHPKMTLQQELIDLILNIHNLIGDISEFFMWLTENTERSE